jgi:hypothetical protein
MFRLRLERIADEGQADRVVVERVWESRHLSNDVASSVLVDDAIFGFDLRDVQAKPHRPSRGQFRCLDLSTGEVQWESDLPGHATIVVADGKLILFNDRGELILARATRERYEELARTTVFVDEMCWTAPAIHGNRLYLRTPTRAACIHLGTPDALNEREQRRVVPTSEVQQPFRVNLNVLLGGEREYLWDPPDRNEHTRCFVASLAAALIPAWVIASALYCVMRVMSLPQASVVARCGLWATAVVLGFVATPALNRWLDAFHFTWPFSLAVGLLALVVAVMWAEAKEDRRQARWITRGLGIAFLVLVGLYFAACGRLGLPLHWVFITGLIPAALLAIPAGIAVRRTKYWFLVDPTVMAIYFAGYYWGSAMILHARITYF